MGKFADWFSGPEMYTKADVEDLIAAKERHHTRKFESEIKLLKTAVANLWTQVGNIEPMTKVMLDLQNRLNDLEAWAALPPVRKPLKAVTPKKSAKKNA